MKKIIYKSIITMDEKGRITIPTIMRNIIKEDNDSNKYSITIYSNKNILLERYNNEKKN